MENLKSFPIRLKYETNLSSKDRLSAEVVQIFPLKFVQGFSAVEIALTL